MPIPRTMKAAVLHDADDVRVEEWPVPEPGPGEVLLRVAVASICGTDSKVLHRALAGQPSPSRGEGGRSCARSLALLGAGRIVAEPIVTHRFTLDQVHAALDTAIGRKDEALKVAIHI